MSKRVSPAWRDNTPADMLMSESFENEAFADLNEEPVWARYSAMKFEGPELSSTFICGNERWRATMSMFFVAIAVSIAAVARGAPGASQATPVRQPWRAGRLW